MDAGTIVFRNINYVLCQKIYNIFVIKSMCNHNIIAKGKGIKYGK